MHVCSQYGGTVRFTTQISKLASSLLVPFHSPFVLSSPQRQLLLPLRAVSSFLCPQVAKIHNYAALSF